MSIKAVFFDTSDTLYHSPEFKNAQNAQPILQLSRKRNISEEEAKILFKKTKEELERESVHVPKVAVMMKLGISRVEMQEELARVDASEFLTEDIMLHSILKRISKKYKLGVLTNILERFLDRILESLNLEKSLFSYIVSVDNTKNSKPHQEPFLKAIELAGVKPGECVYVGDSLTKDIIPAKKAGMHTIWVSKESHKDSNVDRHISNIYEIESALEKLD